jgi:glycosyltransferase involved in cell wall biosynthesis
LNSKSILIVTEFFYPEEFKINDIALYWVKKGFKVDVLTLTPTYPIGKIFDGYKNSILRKDNFQGIRIYRIRAISGYQKNLFKKILKYLNFMMIGSIVGICIGRRYDYIFGFNVSALTSMVPAYTIRKLYKKPLMLWVQDLWPDSVYAYGFKKTKILSYILDRFVKAIYQNISAIAISGKGFESKLKPYVKSNLTFNYLPNWADELNISEKGIKLSQDEKVHFTFAGNIGKVQNLEKIIEAFFGLPESSQKKSQLNIIGDGSNLEYLKDLSSNNEKIVFHGKIKRSDMSKYYKSSDFLIVSLVDKPIFDVIVPAKIQTYIAAKKPILAVIKGDAAEIIDENNLGLSVDPSNIPLIQEAMEKCINMSTEDKASFTKNSERILQTLFNKDTILNKITNILIN